MTSTPPDTSQPPSILLRNRENQRASRARRKGYIEDLEQRVRTYERDGAIATVEVQSAARRVAEENFWLRQMLSVHGHAKNDVDEFVERNRSQATNCSQATNSGQPVQSAKLLPLQRVPARKRKHGEMSARELEAARTLGQIESPVHHAVPSWETMQSPKMARETFRDLPTPEDSYASEQEHTSCTSSDLREMSEQQDRYQPQVSASASAYPEIQMLPKRQVCSYDAPDHPRQTDVTPCEEAAQIIASMRGHEDAEAVWSELGCSSEARCTVKNMTIFQLGDVER
jgi:hypothetical protein